MLVNKISVSAGLDGVSQLAVSTPYSTGQYVQYKLPSANMQIPSLNIQIGD
jgi:hypothetical protein